MAGFTINHVAVSGNLTRDPELRSLPSGQTVCNIGIAFNERIKVNDQWTDRANFVDVTIWGGLGEWVGQNMTKGEGIAIAGRLRYESWEKDGQKRSKLGVVADSIMPRNGGGGGGGFQQREQQQFAHTDAPAATDDFASSTGGTYGSFGGAGAAVGDDDIPFLYEVESLGWDNSKMTRHNPFA